MAIVETAIEGRVAIVTVNRPDVMNAFNTATLFALKEAFGQLALREDVGCIVLTGAGKAFVAGADISEMQDKDPTEGRVFAELGQSVMASIEGAPQPVIAAVNGFALGGGCELALACDIRLASEKARFGQVEVNLGIAPGWGGTQRLSRLCGPGFARELVFTGRMCSAEEALKWGLVNAVYSPEELPVRARELAETIASKSRIILHYTKLAALRAFDQDLAGGLRMEADLFGLCFATHDQKEGMTAFLEKRAPEFKHC